MSSSFHYTESFTSETVQQQPRQTLSSISKSYSTANFARTGQALSNSRATNNKAVNQIAADLLELQQGTHSQVARSSSVANFSQQSKSRASQNTYASSASQAFISDVEAAILRANIPIELNESEEITVNGQRGIWANRSEVLNWRGVCPISEYQINADPNPEIITKRACQSLECNSSISFTKLRV
jgi:hypothetical protein